VSDQLQTASDKLDGWREWAIEPIIPR